MVLLSEVKNFFLHLRLHYQFFIISGAYLFGAVLSPQVDLIGFFIQFLNVHISLLGGATAYNSYYDKDKGPIGGLKNPPKMSKWMLYVSWIFQVTGLFVASYSGVFFFTTYIVSMVFSWFYSSPNIRWKGKPILSLVAIGTCIGGAFFMGYFAFGGNIISIPSIVSSLGVSLLILSMFPMSQAYQIKEDKKRGDITFAVKYGLSGIRMLYKYFYITGLMIVTFGLYLKLESIAILFLALGFIIGVFNLQQVNKLEGKIKEYNKIMRIKYFSGSAFSSFLLILIIWF